MSGKKSIKASTKKVAKKTIAKTKKADSKQKVKKETKVKSLPKEIWKNIKTKSETNRCVYQISNFGRAKSINKKSKVERLLKPAKAAWNFLQLNLVLKNGDKQGLYYHRMVANAFLKKKKGATFVVHLDGNKENNHVENLKWVDQKTLTEIQKENGLYDSKRYLKNKNVKLTAAKVRSLKKHLQKGKLTKTALSAKYKVSMTQIKRIERGENWGEITID